MKKIIYLLLTFTLFSIASIQNNAMATLYIALRSGDANNLANWVENGGGPHPTSFTNYDDEFGIPEGISMFTTADWDVASVIVIGDLTIKAGHQMDIRNKGHLIIIGEKAKVTANGPIYINQKAEFHITAGTYIHNNVVDPRGSIYAGEESFSFDSKVIVQNWSSSDVSLIDALSQSRDEIVIGPGFDFAFTDFYYYGNLTLDLPANFSGDWYQKIPTQTFCPVYTGGGWGDPGTCIPPTPANFTINKLYIKSLGGATFMPHEKDGIYKYSSPVGPPATILDEHPTKKYKYDFFKVGSFQLDNGVVDLNKGMWTRDLHKWVQNPGSNENLGMCMYVKNGEFKVGAGGSVIATESIGRVPMDGIFGLIVIVGNNKQSITLNSEGKIDQTGVICINKQEDLKTGRSTRIYNADPSTKMEVVISNYFTLGNDFSYLQCESADLYADYGLEGKGSLFLVDSDIIFEHIGTASVYSGIFGYYRNSSIKFLGKKVIQNTGNVLKGNMNIKVYVSSNKLNLDQDIVLYDNLYLDQDAELALGDHSLTIDNTIIDPMTGLPLHDGNANLVLMGGITSTPGYITMEDKARLSLPVKSDGLTIFPIKSSREPFFVGMKTGDPADNANFMVSIRDLVGPPTDIFVDKDYVVQKKYFINRNYVIPNLVSPLEIHFGYSPNKAGSKFNSASTVKVVGYNVTSTSDMIGNTSSIFSPLCPATSVFWPYKFDFGQLNFVVGNQMAFPFAPVFLTGKHKEELCPNPVITGESLIFTHELKESSDVKIELYNEISGVRALSLEDKDQAEGIYTKNISTSHLSSGNYICKIFFTEEATPKIITKHLIVK